MDGPDSSAHRVRCEPPPSAQQMTYARQLQDYEEAVMRKRLEELPEQELERLMDEGERQRQARQAQRQQQQ